MERFSVFLTVGTQLPFDRLVRACEQTHAESALDFRVTYQVGNGGHAPLHGECYEVMTRAQFDSALQSSDLVITHAGIGSIVSCISQGKPVIVLPRLAAFGEHRNDHQLATARAIESEVMVAKDAQDVSRLLLASIRNEDHQKGPGDALNFDFSLQLMKIIGQ